MIASIREYLKLRKERIKVLEDLTHNRRNCVSICGDPMNGCPGDFAEDYDRSLWSGIHDAWALGISQEKIDNAIQRGIEQGNKDLDDLYTAIRGDHR